MIGRPCRWSGRHPFFAATIVLTVIACAWLPGVLRGHQLGQSYILASDPPFALRGPAAGTLPPRAVFPDAGLQFHPWQVVAREQVVDGHLPLWNPYEFAGTPLLGNMQSALTFPLTWLALLVSPDVAAGLIAIAKLALAGLGAFALTRELGVRRWGGALLAGTVYMVAAPMVVLLQWPIATAFAMYPWLLLATHRLVERRGPRGMAAMAAAVTLTILAGHPESALAALSAAGVYLVVLLAYRLRRAARSAVAAGARWLLAAGLGVAGAAVVLLPFDRALDASVTKATHGVVGVDLPFYSALQFLAPHLFGNAQPNIYGFIFYTGIAGYFGVPALMLALVALWRFRARPATIALAVTALVALMVTWEIPPVSWWTSNVSPWSTAVLSGRVYFVVALAAAVGAGAGYSALCDLPLRARNVVLLTGAVVSALALGVALAEARDLLEAPAEVKRDALLLAGAAIAAGALLLVGLGRMRTALMLPAAIVVAALSMVELRGVNVTLEPHDAYPPTPGALRFLQSQSWPFRVQVIRSRGSMAPANSLAAYGLESLEGYDFPLDKRWSDVQGAALRYAGLMPERTAMIGPPQPEALTSLRLFNVRYYLAEPGAAAPVSGFERVYSGADGTVFRDPRALPRAFVVPSTRPLEDEQGLATLAAAGFEPSEVALVAPDAPRPPAGGAFTRARVERVGPDRLRVHLPSGTAGWLVIGNAYSDAWTASVDGRSAEVEPTDYAAMGLPVSAGDRTVEVWIDRSRYLVGAAISLLALIAMAVLALLARGAAGPARPPPAPPATAPPSA
jgi:hypothetical protein